MTNEERREVIAEVWKALKDSGAVSDEGTFKDVWAVIKRLRDASI